VPNINLEMAQVRELFLDDDGKPNPNKQGKIITVQFNPDTLKVTRNRTQISGPSTATLSVTLVYDVTVLDDSAQLKDRDALLMTREIDYFTEFAEDEGGADGAWVRGVRFLWGNFSFDGWVSNLEKTYDNFARDGTPLRATVQLTLTTQDMFD
jgi:hypothetical protein